MNNNHIFMDIELPEVLSQSTINEYIIEAQKGNRKYFWVLCWCCNKKSLLKLKKNLEAKHIPKKKEVIKEPVTIYEYFKEYNRVEINEMLASLNETEKYLLTSKYGLDLDNPKSNENWNDEYEGVFNELLIPKMEKVLRKNDF